MSSDPHTLLHLMWLASPALPVGGFSYSEGLEAAVDAALVHDEGSAAQWLQDQLRLVLVRCEWPIVALAHAAWASPAWDCPNAGSPFDMASDARPPDDVILQANDWVLATRESRELALQAEQMGRSLAQWLMQRHAQDRRVQWLCELQRAPSWPVAFALAGALARATPMEVLLAHGFSWAENQVQAAIKCIPLGQSAGQRVLAGLTEAIAPAAQAICSGPLPQAQAYAPGLAILSARHEQQYSRLFRS